MADDATEKARIKFEEEKAKRNRQQELDRRAVLKKSQDELAKKTVVGIVSG